MFNKTKKPFMFLKMSKFKNKRNCWPMSLMSIIPNIRRVFIFIYSRVANIILPPANFIWLLVLESSISYYEKVVMAKYITSLI